MKKLLLGSALVFLLSAAIVIALIVTSNPPLPTPTTTPSLALPKTPPQSSAMYRWLKAANLSRKATSGAHGPLWKQLKRELREARWFSRPQKVKALLKTLDKDLAGFRNALNSKGCLPVQDFKTPDEPSEFSYLHLMYGLDAWVAKAVLELQQGDASRGVKILLQLQERLFYYEQTCGANLIGTMVMAVCVKRLQRALLYVLRHPNVTRQNKEKVIGWWHRWAKRKNVMQVAFRWEARFMERAVKSLGKSGRRGVSLAMVKAAWPFFDKKENIQLTQEEWRCVLRKDQHPIHRQASAPKCAIEKYWEKINKQPKWRTAFRYNSVGKILMAIARPNFHKYAVKWWQTVCYPAALHTRWVRGLKKEEKTLWSTALQKPLHNPLTAKPFGALGREVCSIPKSLKFSMKPLRFPKAPAAPVTAAPTPAPPPRTP